MGDRWALSKWKESEGTAGKWAAATGKWFGDEAEDAGMETTEDSKFFGISAGFDSFSNAGKDLIIQYQAKYEKDVECGGGYVKIGAKKADLAYKQEGEGTSHVYRLVLKADNTVRVEIDQ